MSREKKPRSDKVLNEKELEHFALQIHVTGLLDVLCWCHDLSGAIVCHIAVYYYYIVLSLFGKGPATYRLRGATRRSIASLYRP